MHCVYIFTYIGDTNLPGKYDILRIDLNPKDEYKSVNYSYLYLYICFGLLLMY